MPSSMSRMTDGVRPLPHWLIWMGRAALILMPLVLLFPSRWWSGIAAVAVAIVVFSFLRRVAEGRS